MRSDEENALFVVSPKENLSHGDCSGTAQGVRAISFTASESVPLVPNVVQSENRIMTACREQ